MFLDASVIVAILAREPGCEVFERQIEEAKQGFLTSAIGRYEATLAFARIKAGGRPSDAELRNAMAIVDSFLADLGVSDVPMDANIGRGAVEAAAVWGKAVGHPAQLNLGDCFAYACAKAQGVLLLYKGNDFVLTDLA